MNSKYVPSFRIFIHVFPFRVYVNFIENHHAFLFICRKTQHQQLESESRLMSSDLVEH